MKESHYFAVDCYGWATANTWEEAKDKRQKDSGTKKLSLSVYKVPLPESASYDISHYVPVVEGIKLVYMKPAKTMPVDK